MSDHEEGKPIPKKFLCRRCNFSGGTLTDDGLVTCSVSHSTVIPVEKRVYERFENCPQRTATAQIPSCKLKLLAIFARRLRLRAGLEDTRSRFDTAEAAIRADLHITARL